MPGIEFDFEKESADIAPAMRMIYQTYTDVMPYPHKFNDALLKANLVGLDLAVKHNLWQERAEHEAEILAPILEMIKGKKEEGGPDKGLYGMFEANSCNYQLFERIEVKDCKRSFPCPYKEMLEIVSVLGTLSIELEDVCHKGCIPLWKEFAKRIDFELEFIPGDICTVKIKK